MTAEYKVKNRRKEGNRNVYLVQHIGTGQMAEMYTKELGQLCKQGLVYGFSGDEKQVYPVKVEQPKAKDISSIFEEEDSKWGIKLPVMKRLVEYVRDVRIPKEKGEELNRVLEHNEYVKPEGTYRSATLYEPPESPTVDVMNLVPGFEMTSYIQVDEQGVYKELLTMGVGVKARDVEALEEDRGIMMEFWERFIVTLMRDNKYQRNLEDAVAYGVELGFLEDYEFDVIREEPNLYSYGTATMVIDEDAVVEQAFSRVEF